MSRRGAGPAGDTAATLAVGYLLINLECFSDLAQSTAYATVSTSNAHFGLSRDYFDATATARPLLHTWSLAAEWRLYLI